jgi:hypothetical protein
LQLFLKLRCFSFFKDFHAIDWIRSTDTRIVFNIGDYPYHWLQQLMKKILVSVLHATLAVVLASAIRAEPVFASSEPSEECKSARKIGGKGEARQSDDVCDIELLTLQNNKVSTGPITNSLQKTSVVMLDRD